MYTRESQYLLRVVQILMIKTLIISWGSFMIILNLSSYIWPVVFLQSHCLQEFLGIRRDLRRGHWLLRSPEKALYSMIFYGVRGQCSLSKLRFNVPLITFRKHSTPKNAFLSSKTMLLLKPRRVAKMWLKQAQGPIKICLS